MSISKIQYRFGDSSVPPPFHRSYSIVLTPSEIHTVVDSYGEVVAEKREALEEQAFAGIVAALRNCNIHREQRPETQQGCTGGTTESVSYWAGEEKAFHASVYHCGGSDEGDLSGDVAGFAATIRALVPDLSQMRK